MDEKSATLAEEIETEIEGSAVKAPELSCQLKESRKTLHEAEQGMWRLQERIRVLEADALQNHSELSQLRETMSALRSKENQPEEVLETEIKFPWQTKR